MPEEATTTNIPVEWGLRVEVARGKLKFTDDQLSRWSAHKKNCLERVFRSVDKNYYSGDVRSYIGNEWDLSKEFKDDKYNFYLPWLYELRHERNKPILSAISLIDHIQSNIAFYLGDEIKILFFKFLKILGPVPEKLESPIFRLVIKIINSVTHQLSELDHKLGLEAHWKETVPKTLDALIDIDYYLAGAIEAQY
ncbi:MAG: hypothetical protein Q9212_004816, partial [Teloschistes hypoglaucus]